MAIEKLIIKAASRPTIKRSSDGELFAVVRNDKDVNGKIWLAPVGKAVEMFSIKYNELVSQYGPVETPTTVPEKTTVSAPKPRRRVIRKRKRRTLKTAAVAT